MPCRRLRLLDFLPHRHYLYLQSLIFILYSLYIGGVPATLISSRFYYYSAQYAHTHCILNINVTWVRIEILEQLFGVLLVEVGFLIYTTIGKLFRAGFSRKARWPPPSIEVNEKPDCFSCIAGSCTQSTGEFYFSMTNYGMAIVGTARWSEEMQQTCIIALISA